MNQEIYLLLGSNLEDRKQWLTWSKNELEKRGWKILSESAIYETEAWGHTDQNSFLNACIKIEEKDSPFNLLKDIAEIEQLSERQRRQIWGPRQIDIDILFWGTTTLQSQRLTIPHPLLHTRRFTLVPMVEMAPDLIHPVLKKTMQQLLNDCEDDLNVTIFAE